MKEILSANQIVVNTNKKRHLFKKSNYLLLMVSGGSDSVSLSYIINDLLGNKKFAIMHLNHNLREGANKDADFVQTLADYLDVPYFGYSEEISKIAKENNQNIEACGHDIRYKLANEACKTWSENAKIKLNKILICTAHNADDRIENFYMRSIVGTGPGGFASMSYKNGNVIRPLLDLSKEALAKFILDLPEKYKDENGKFWHDDCTNFETDKFRTYVRHNIIPLAKHQNPQLINNLCNSMNLIADESEYIERQVNDVIEKYITINDTSFSISPDFISVDIVLKRRAIYNCLLQVFKPGTRIETKSIASVIQATQTHNYTDNIQENYSVHSNNKATLVQPMQEYRESRNRL